MITSGYTHVHTHAHEAHTVPAISIFLVVHLSNFTAPLRSTTRSRAQDLQIDVAAAVVVVFVVARVVVAVVVVI